MVLNVRWNNSDIYTHIDSKTSVRLQTGGSVIETENFTPGFLKLSSASLPFPQVYRSERVEMWGAQLDYC